VRRAADKASQRIIGYWMYFGEWAGIMGDEESGRAVARELVDQGLPRMAIDLIQRTDGEPDSVTAAVVEDIQGRDEEMRWAKERDYPCWFGDAKEEDEAVRAWKKDLNGCKRALSDQR
jgi:hypothetical protein